MITYLKAAAAFLIAALLLTPLAATSPAAASEDVVSNCPAGFEVTEDQKFCTRGSESVVIDATCPTGATGEPGNCYVVQPRDVAGATTCANGATPGNAGCLVDQQVATPGCTPPAMLVAGTNDCLSLAAAVQTCPNQGVAPNCVRNFTAQSLGCVTGSLLRDRCVEGAPAVSPGQGQPLVCLNNGTLVDGFCVVADLAPAVVGPGPCPTGTATAVLGQCAQPENSVLGCANNSAPKNGQCQLVAMAVAVCPSGYDQRGTDCARFEAPVTTFVCRDVAQDIDGECRRSVPTTEAQVTCVDPEASLRDEGCVLGVRARRAPQVRYPGKFKNMPPGPDGGLFAPVYATLPEPSELTRAERRELRAQNRAGRAEARTELALTGVASEAAATIALVLVGAGCGVTGSIRSRRYR